MNRKESIKILQAAEEGKEIEYKSNYVDDEEWADHNGYSWDFTSYIYRIKKVPRKIWVNEYESNHDGSISTSLSESLRKEGCCASPLRKRIVYIEVLDDE